MQDQDIVIRATAHANEFEDVRWASCELLRECVAEIERLRQENGRLVAAGQGRVAAAG